jgi:hypothetical protein
MQMRVVALGVGEVKIQERCRERIDELCKELSPIALALDYVFFMQFSDPPGIVMK